MGKIVSISVRVIGVLLTLIGFIVMFYKPSGLENTLKGLSVVAAGLLLMLLANIWKELNEINSSLKADSPKALKVDDSELSE